MKRIIRKIANTFGIDIIKLKKSSSSNNPYCKYSKVKSDIVDVEILEKYNFDKVFYNWHTLFIKILND